MLSISKCRELLGDTNLTDKEIEKLRNVLYQITNQISDLIIQDIKKCQNQKH